MTLVAHQPAQPDALKLAGQEAERGRIRGVDPAAVQIHVDINQHVDGHAGS